MLNKLHLTTAVVAGLACLAASAAHADIMWSLSNVNFNDGGTATGSFVITDLGNITAWDITTTIGSTLGGATYDNTRGGSVLQSTLSSTITFEDITDTTGLTLTFSNPLTTMLSSPDPIGQGGNAETTGPTVIRDVIGGEAIAAVPAPAPSNLAGLGMLGLVFLWRRRRQILGLVQ
jgi:MYXO-CTERM domain-containing protein